VCAGNQVLEGFNDLALLRPDLAAEAHGWDPSTVTVGATLKRPWMCPAGHTWQASVASRSRGSGCPVCSPRGFDPGRPAWLYLLERPGEQQVGITGNLPQRMGAHGRDGWQPLDVHGPLDGFEAQRLEAGVRRWLHSNGWCLPGTAECWSTGHVEVSSLRELIELSRAPV
jgi:hypothetical protein